MNIEFTYIHLYWHIIAISVLLIISGYVLKKDSSQYLPLLLAVNIFGMMPQFFGYYFYDEFFTLILSASFLLLYVQKRGVANLVELLSRKSSILVVLFSLYMALQSVVGIIENDDIRILRWVVFYLGLIPLYASVTLSLERSGNVNNSIILLIVVYLLIYLLIGVYFEFTYGNRFHSQISFVGGTSYSLFPILLLYIAMYSNIRKGKANPSVVNNYFIVAMLIFIGMYLDSRLIQVSLFIWLVTLVFIGRYFLWLKMSLIYAAVVMAYVSVTYTWFTIDQLEPQPAQPVEVLESKPTEKTTVPLKPHFQSQKILDGLNVYVNHNIVGSLIVFFKDNDSDFTRSLQLQAVKDIFDKANITRKLFGYGAYSHKVLMAKEMNLLLDKNLTRILISEKASKITGTRSDATKVNRIYRTNAINAILVDFGLVGVALLISLYAVLFNSLLVRRDREIYSIMAVLGLSFIWLFFSNINDVYLLYMMLIPGLIHKITDKEVRT